MERLCWPTLYLLLAAQAQSIVIVSRIAPQSTGAADDPSSNSNQSSNVAIKVFAVFFACVLGTALLVIAVIYHKIMRKRALQMNQESSLPSILKQSRQVPEGVLTEQVTSVANVSQSNDGARTHHRLSHLSELDRACHSFQSHRASFASAHPNVRQSLTSTQSAESLSRYLDPLPRS